MFGAREPRPAFCPLVTPVAGKTAVRGGVAPSAGAASNPAWQPHHTFPRPHLGSCPCADVMLGPPRFLIFVAQD